MTNVIAFIVVIMKIVYGAFFFAVVPLLNYPRAFFATKPNNAPAFDKEYDCLDIEQTFFKFCV